MKVKTILNRRAEALEYLLDDGIADPSEYRLVSDAADGLRRAAVIGRYTTDGIRAVLALAEYDLNKFEAEKINVAPEILQIGPFRYRRELDLATKDNWRALKNRVRHLRSVLRHRNRMVGEMS